MNTEAIMALADAYAQAAVTQHINAALFGKRSAMYESRFYELDEARAALEAALTAKQEPDQRLLNLLCRIHRDGGHYIAEHGLDRAAADADVLVAELFAMHGDPPAPEAKQEPYDKTEMNAFVQNLYDQKMQEGKHGHYETMFHVVHQAIKRALPAPEAKQGEQEAVCPLCHGKGEHEMFSAHLPGQPVPERRMVKCNQCANHTPSVNAQERISELEAKNAQLVVALKDIAHGLEKARIWGGMDWKYNPLHPFIYLPLRDKARAAIAAAEGKT